MGSRVESPVFLSRYYYSVVGSCQGEGMGRQKFRLLTSWGLSKRKKKKTSRCQDSREMFVDFLLCIYHFQLGFEANCLVEGLPGAGGEFTASLLWFSGHPQPQNHRAAPG